MAIMPAEVKELFEVVPCVIFATAREDAQPNACIVGMKRLIDDETIYLSDQYFNKTLDNVLANQKVSVVFWKGHDAYQIYGTATYVNEGPEFEEQKAWSDAIFEAKGAPMRAKGGCFVHVDEVFSSSPSATVKGEKIA